jgi:hypothetical protein
MPASMHDKLPELGCDGLRLRTRAHLAEDIRYLLAGKLDRRSFISGYTKVKNPVEVKVFDGPKLAKMGCTLIPERIVDSLGNVERAHWRYNNSRIDLTNDPRWKPALRQVVRTHNLRTTQGRDNFQRLQISGNITANASGYTGVTGTATATTSTSLTNSGAAFPTSGGPNSGLQGQIVVCPVVGCYGVIMSNTATALTVSQWTSMSSATGAAGSTPASTAVYAIMPNAGTAQWIGLSTNSSAAAAGDVPRTADGLWGDGTTSGAATEQTGSGLARVFVQANLGTADEIVYTNLFTYTGSSSVTIAKAILFNSVAAAGNLGFLETLLSATATVTSNGDAISITWTLSL